MDSPTISRLEELVIKFRNDRDWSQFHNPKDVALSLALEVAELLELMQWKNGQQLDVYLQEKRIEVGEELSDILYWILLLAHDLKIDLGMAFFEKMAKNEAKYPVEQAKGSSAKYLHLKPSSRL